MIYDPDKGQGKLSAHLEQNGKVHAISPVKILFWRGLSALLYWKMQ